MEIVLATRNKKKVEEIGRILEGMDIELLTLDDFPQCPDVEEDQDTFEGNAVKKAVSIAKCTGRATLSDDSGLEVYALDGAPGVKSARYAGDKSDDLSNLEKLLYEMRDLPLDKRGGRFVCVIALAFPDGEFRTFGGVVEGVIGKQPVGSGGFGYDPVFYPSGAGITFGEMSSAEKDALSHRRIALDKLRAYLKSLNLYAHSRSTRLLI